MSEHHFMDLQDAIRLGIPHDTARELAERTTSGNLVIKASVVLEQLENQRKERQ